MTYFPIGLIIFAALIIYLTNCNNEPTSSQTNKKLLSDTDSAKIHKLPQNRYQELRNIALSVTPQQLGLTLPDQTKVFGVVMDWDLGEVIATLISFETGDASMYLSSGGGVIVGSGHENVINAVKTFVTKAQTFLDKTSKTETTPLPDKNCVRFYLLTNKGKFTAQEELKNIGNNTSFWLPLFEEGNKVIKELRIVESKLQEQ